VSGGIPVLAGDRLPFSAKSTAHFKVQDDFRITERTSGFASVSADYVGSRLGDVNPADQAPDPRELYRSYVRTDLVLGFTRDQWEVTAFVNNLTDQRGRLAGGMSYTPPNAYVYIRPRSFGMSISRDF
jgi:outer membrane receptor protein involved in Fe transport